MGGILGVVSSVFSGGVTGIIGVVAQRAFDAWNKKQELDKLKAQWEHEAVMKDKDAAIAAAEWASRSQIAMTEGDAAKDVAASQAFGESLKAQQIVYSQGRQMGSFATGCLVALDFVSGLVRPLLTVYLCALTTYIWFQVRALLAQEDLDSAQALALWTMVIDTVLYLTTTCVLWWFGTRNKMSQPTLK